MSEAVRLLSPPVSPPIDRCRSARPARAGARVSPTPIAWAAALALSALPGLVDAQAVALAAAPSPARAASSTAPAASPAASGATPAPSAPAEPSPDDALPAPPLRISSSLDVPVGGEDAKELPVYFEADALEGTPGQKVRATGTVRLKRGDLTLHADEVTHTQDDNTAEAQGHVRISRRGDVYTGPHLRLQLDTLQGEFTEPTYHFGRIGAGGKASKVEFLGANRLKAYNASYSSCTPDNPEGLSPEALAASIDPAKDLDWVLTTSAVSMDFEANEGRAENAVVRFMGVPILAAPVLTFPLSDARKSGFLPPSFDVDNKSGFEFALPYYWNIAPNRDATLTPTLSTRRGAGLDAEYRYLEPRDRGSLRAWVLPGDRLADRDRGLIDFLHVGDLNQAGTPTLTNYDIRWRRVSDDDYWKDFSRTRFTLTPRLYESHAGIERQINTRAWGLGDSQTTLYARVQSWQTLQDLDPTADPSSRIISPYRREPQLGLRSRSSSESGVMWRFESEFNHFGNQDNERVTGSRVHALAQVERPFGDSGWHFTPKLALNGASYSLDRNDAQPLLKRSISRVIPTLSLDSGLSFDRTVNWFGSALTQTLEPRVQYVYTPYRNQRDIPLFDSAVRDFNEYSIFSENAFTGIDRVSDANQLTLGLTTRLIDPANGAENLRLGIVQKVLFSDQRITPDDGPVNTERLSDVLLLASTSVIPNWYLDSTAQYRPQTSRVERSLVGVRYSPGPWRTISANYRYTRRSSEQLDLGWQWPIAGRAPGSTVSTREDASPLANIPKLTGASSSHSCGGTWYSVGRLNYSLKDKRLSDALVGFEYDSGCWIGRVVAERVSVGRADASTRLMFQLELVGLSRLGSSPLNTLRDNIPGYRLLREDTGLLAAPASTSTYAHDD